MTTARKPIDEAADSIRVASRRHFFKRAAALSGAASLAAFAPLRLSAAETSPVFDETADLVVIGTGAAGSAAAARAAQLGLSVIVLEKLRTTGGSTAVCNGGFAICGTDLQKAAGIDDSPELFEKELLAMGKVNDPELVRTYVTACLPVYEWAKSLGVEFGAPTTGAGMSVPRQHMTKTSQMLEVFQNFARSKGAVFHLNTAAERLVTNAAGRVVGVTARSGKKTRTYGAKRGVVIAAGGWARGEDLLRRFSPAAEKALKLGGLGNTGDGSKMAWALGADLLDVSYTKATYGFNPKTKTSAFVMYQGAVIVNKEGLRFADESRPYKELGEIVMTQPDGIGYQVYDASVHEEAQKDPLAKTDRLKAAGELHTADTLEALAEKIGVPPKALAETVAAYNRGIVSGADAFGRSSLSAGGGKPLPIERPPFYAFAATACLLSTYCGPKIDARARVRTVFDEPIPGLFAAGEGTGGFHGAAYMSGTSVGKAVIFGKIAAESAAAEKA